MGWEEAGETDTDATGDIGDIWGSEMEASFDSSSVDATAASPVAGTVGTS